MFTYYVSKIFGFLTPLPPLVSICQQQGQQQQQQPRTLHRAGKYQIELVKQTRNKMQKKIM